MKTALSIVKKYLPGITKVVDAKSPVTIEVSRADCRKSKALSPDGCALALAARRKYDDAIISVTTAYLVRGAKAYRYKLPQSVQREIVSFDRHADFSPGRYRLIPLAESLRIGVVAPRKVKSKRNKARGSRHVTSGLRSI